VYLIITYNGSGIDDDGVFTLETLKAYEFVAVVAQQAGS
jgi:hypothetical protein